MTDTTRNAATTPSAADPRTIAEVGVLLARAGLPATGPEVTVLATGYTIQQAGIEALYQLPDARHVDPALRFHAGARLTEWSE
jgi:hypothetical protein